MADHQDSPSGSGDIAHLAQASLLKLRVTDCKHFIDNQNLWFQMRGDAKGEAQIHSA
jgi:hypothetical protein